PLCYKSVVRLLKKDVSRCFLFAPLGGESAKEILIGPNAHYGKENSLVLVELFQSDRRCFWVRSKAIFRIYWLMGNRWVGVFCFLPSWTSDWAYRRLAKHRHHLRFGCERPEFQNNRFLP